MKKLFFLSSVFLFLISCKTQCDSVRKIDKEHRYAPPGTVWIKDSIYMDQCEIRNVDYLEYVQWLKKYDPLNYSKVLPDSTVWRKTFHCNEPFVHDYFNNPLYKDCPVVGVSYEQVLNFCKWRTDRVKYYAKLIRSRSKYGNTYKNNKFYYRLPTKEEWEYAAHEDFPPPKIEPDSFCRCISISEAEFPIPAKGYPQNFYGLYNMNDNVSEMIADKGISKGGSWMYSINEITDSQKYEMPSAELGFRCVCVVTK